MSARMRSPKLAGYRALRLRVAVVALMTTAIGFLGASHPASSAATIDKTKGQKVVAKARTPHQRSKSHKRLRTAKTKLHPKHKRSAKHRAPRRIAKRSPDPQKLLIPQGDGSPVLSAASRFLGRPYRYGAVGGAFDCSGFVRTVFGKLGIDLPHSAREQFALGDRITRDDLEPGDLVFFRTYRRYATHVGIYVGENRFVHAATRGGQVQVDSLNEAYYAHRYLGARRIEI